MSEPNKPSEAGAAANADATKFVPKEEYEKLAGSVKDLESKLDDAKLSLLDPDYIEFLESKKGAKVEKKVSKALSDAETEKMTSKQILELATERAKDALMEELVPKYEDMLKRQNATIHDILAYIELQEVEKKYKDFDTYREGTKRILENSRTQLTIEQAYKQAKLEKLDSEGKLEPMEKKEPEKSTQTEKPTSSVPGESLSRSTFKDKGSAASDAWDRVVGSGKDIL